MKTAFRWMFKGLICVILAPPVVLSWIIVVKWLSGDLVIPSGFPSSSTPSGSVDPSRAIRFHVSIPTDASYSTTVSGKSYEVLLDPRPLHLTFYLDDARAIPQHTTGITAP